MKHFLWTRPVPSTLQEMFLVLTGGYYYGPLLPMWKLNPREVK